MLKSDFDFNLPPRLIAAYPSAQRTGCRLLALDSAGGLRNYIFADLGALLRPGDLLVLNDTQVIPARLFGHKSTGGRLELLVEKILDSRRALAYIKSHSALRIGAVFQTEAGAGMQVVAREGDQYVVSCPEGPDLREILDREGHMPLPPYLHRCDEPADRERYQTVYARCPGAVAAPTAGLHFDRALLEDLRSCGVDLAFVTLHVGAGTFSPLRSERLEEHHMHSEYVRLDEQVVRQVHQARSRGQRVIAVGTTAVRALESAAVQAAAQGRGLVCPFEGETSIFIYPGYKYKITDAMITNFHLPQSTLIMLVAAFAGFARTMQAYAYAIAQEYHFFSYGDAMFIERNEEAIRDLPPSADGA